MATQTLLTLDQYAELPKQEGRRYELDEGVVIEMSGVNSDHGSIQAELCALLIAGARKVGAELKVMVNVAFILAPATERIPDVTVVRRDKLESMEYYRGAYRGAPELAIEVVSENDSAADLDRKVAQYLAAGVMSVWVIYPETKHIVIHNANRELRDITGDQKLEALDLLPGFSVSLDQIFGS
jgi:Uma2 family endonuclease